MDAGTCAGGGLGGFVRSRLFALAPLEFLVMSVCFTLASWASPSVPPVTVWAGVACNIANYFVFLVSVAVDSWHRAPESALAFLISAPWW